MAIVSEIVATRDIANSSAWSSDIATRNPVPVSAPPVVVTVHPDNIASRPDWTDLPPQWRRRRGHHVFLGLVDGIDRIHDGPADRIGRNHASVSIDHAAAQNGDRRDGWKKCPDHDVGSAAKRSADASDCRRTAICLRCE